jgi:hypothetical protein
MTMEELKDLQIDFSTKAADLNFLDKIVINRY